jgi:hypothetical protein
MKEKEEQKTGLLVKESVISEDNIVTIYGQFLPYDEHVRSVPIHFVDEDDNCWSHYIRNPDSLTFNGVPVSPNPAIVLVDRSSRKMATIEPLYIWYEYLEDD